MSVLRDDSSHSSPSFSSSENPSPCALPPSNSNVPRLSFPFGDDYVSCSDSPPSCMRNRERPPEEVEDNPSKKKITFSFSSPPIFTRTRNDSCPPLPEICRVPPSTPPPTTKSKSIVKTHSNEIVPGPRLIDGPRGFSISKSPDMVSSSPRDYNHHHSPKWLQKVSRSSSDSLKLIRKKKTCTKKSSIISDLSPRRRLPSDTSEFQTLEEIIFRLIDEPGETELGLPLLFYHTSLFFASSEEVMEVVRDVVVKKPSLCEAAIAFVSEWICGDYDSSSELIASEKASSSLGEWLSGLGEGRAEVKKIRDCLKRRANKKIEQIPEAKQKQTEGADPLPFIPMASLKWTGYNEEWLAATVTLHEFSLFSAIPLSDFVYHVLHKEEKEDAALPLNAAIAFFNSLSHWVTMTLVKEAHLKRRIEYLNKIIRIADHLVHLNNYSGVMAILAGLNNFSVSRMKQTWKGVEPDLYEKYTALETLMNHTCNYSAYRTALKTCGGPCIPYLGLILSDLTFIESGNIGKDEDKINFSKWVMIGDVLETIATQRKYPFLSLQETPQLLLFIPALSAFEYINDDECEWYSKIMEPADHEDTISHLVEELLNVKRQNELLQKKLEAAN